MVVPKTPSPPPSEVVEEDGFSPARARQVLAMLDRDPSGLRAGDVLPRGWHSAMFAPAVRPSGLRPDGFAGIGVALPDVGLPRLVFGGRRIAFEGDLRIGAPARRVTRLLSATEKRGRSGRLMVVSVARDVHDAEGRRVVAEQQDYVPRAAAAPGEGSGDPAGPDVQAAGPTSGGRPFVADAAMLLRYCALTFNTHRIHYDHPCATGVEGYPALVVNGTLTALVLFELFRERARREPVEAATRNLQPLFCDRANTLHAAPAEGDWWRLWAEDERGRVALEAALR